MIWRWLFTPKPCGCTFWLACDAHSRILSEIDEDLRKEENKKADIHVKLQW